MSVLILNMSFLGVFFVASETEAAYPNCTPDTEEREMCGNCVVEPGIGEECDNGEANHAVGSMPPVWNMEEGQGDRRYCSSDKCQTFFVPGTWCGDGVQQVAHEECDDENIDNGDGCSSVCKIEPTHECLEGDKVEFGEYLDSVDIGSITSEVGHGFPDGWSETNLENSTFGSGGYGGHSNDGTHRQVWEPEGNGKLECKADGNTASLELSVPEGYYASSLEINYLDGCSGLDGFNVYVNGNLVHHNTDNGLSSESWDTISVVLDSLTGTIEVEFEVTDEEWNDSESMCCDKWGQVAFSWVGIKGYSCEEEHTYTLNIWKYDDADGDGEKTSGEAPVSDPWPFEIIYPGESTSTATTTTNGLISISPAELGGTYKITEQTKSGWTLTGITGNATATSVTERWAEITIPSSPPETNDVTLIIYFHNYYPECGNGILDAGEQCESCSDCESYGSNYYCSNCECVQESSGSSDPCNYDDICDEGETCSNCSEDCGSCSSGGYFTYSNQGSGATTPPSGTTPPAVLGEEGAPSLTVSKTIAQEFANPGDTDILYTITITNNGNITAFIVTLIDTLPTGLHYADVSGNTRTWELGDIGPGETKESNYFVNVDEDAQAMIYTNTAQVSASNHDPVSAQASLEVRGVEVLAETGFSLGEFFTLLALLFGLTGVSIFLRKRLA